MESLKNHNGVTQESQFIHSQESQWSHSRITMESLNVDINALIVEALFQERDKQSLDALMRASCEFRRLVSARVKAAVVKTFSDDLSGFPRHGRLESLLIIVLGMTSGEASSWMKSDKARMTTIANVRSLQLAPSIGLDRSKFLQCQGYSPITS